MNINRMSRARVALVAAAILVLAPLAAPPASAEVTPHPAAVGPGTVLPSVPAVTVMPDMAVSFVVKIPNANGPLPYYMFKTKNIGGTTAKNVKIVQVAYLRYSSNNQHARTQIQEFTKWFSPGQEQSYTVICTPPPGTYCSSVGVMIQSVENGD